jgi:hypothetical protein
MVMRASDLRIPAPPDRIASADRSTIDRSTVGSATMTIPMPTGSGSTTVSSVTIIKSRAGILAITERKKYLSSGAGWRGFFVTIWPDQGAVESFVSNKNCI